MNIHMTLKMRMALQQANEKERAMSIALDGAVKSIGMPKGVSKNMITLFKVAEQEYIKALRQLHEVARSEE